MEYKTICDNNGYIVDLCVICDNGIVENFDLKNNYTIVERYITKMHGKFIKPKLDFEKQIWEEGATEEEAKEWQKSNKLSIKEPTQQDILNAKLLQDNAELLKANEQQKKLNADLLLKIAMLGGAKNV